MPNLYRNASWGGLSAGVRLMFGMLNLFLAIRLVGAASYGYFVVMSSVTAFYVALINSVHVISVTKAVEIRNQADAEENLRVLFSAVWLMTLLGVALLLLVAALWGEFFVHGFIYGGGDAQLAAQLKALLIPVVLIVVCQLLGAGHMVVIESLGRFDSAAKAQMFGTPTAFFVLFFALLAGFSPNIVDVGWILLAGAAVDMLCMAYARLGLGYAGCLKPNGQGLKLLPQLLGHGSTLQGAKLVNIFFDPFNKFLLNHFVGSASVSAYEIGMKVIKGIQAIYAGAFRAFLQLAEKLRADGSSDYVKTIRYGFMPAVLMYGFGSVLMVLLSRFWIPDEVKQLTLFYLILVAPGIGIIFAAPLFNALIGIRDLGFIFRMHLNLAALNLIASLVLIPVLGLLGAAIGLLIATAYNAHAEYRRYLIKIGPIVGLAGTLRERLSPIVFAWSLMLVMVLADRYLADNIHVLIVAGVVGFILSAMLLREPLSLRVLMQIRAKLGAKPN